MTTCDGLLSESCAFGQLFYCYVLMHSDTLVNIECLRSTYDAFKHHMRLIIHASRCLSTTFNAFKHHLTRVSAMIRFRLRELMAEKGFREKRLITMGEIATATGLNRSTITKVANTADYNCTSDVIDKLCFYFDCEISDLMVHIKTQDENPPA